MLELKLDGKVGWVDALATYGGHVAEIFPPSPVGCRRGGKRRAGTFMAGEAEMNEPLAV